MELTNILLLSLVTVPLGYIIGVNHRYYTDVSDWMENHKSTNFSYYQERLEKQKAASFKGKIDYYISYPARVIAFKTRNRGR